MKAYEYWNYVKQIEKECLMPKVTKPKKRGRKLGVKVGPYKPQSLKVMWAELKALRAIVMKHEKVLS